MAGNSIHTTFSDILQQSFGTAENAPGSVYSAAHTDQYNLQLRFRNTSPEHIRAVYDMSGCNYERAVQLLITAGQRDCAGEHQSN